jgi:hypothetical protein
LAVFGYIHSERLKPLAELLTGASGVRAIDKTLGGVEDKNKVIIARFDVG